MRTVYAAYLVRGSVENLLGGAFARGNGAVYGGAMAVQLRGFAGEVECCGNRRGENGAGGQGVGGHIAVSATGEWIGVPIVEISRFEEIGDAGGIGQCNAGQGIDGLGHDVRVRLAEKRIRMRARAPAGNEGSTHGQMSPPGGEGRFIGKQEAGEGDTFVLFPERFPEAQSDVQHLANGKTAGGLERIAGFRFKMNAAFRLEHAQRHGDDYAAAADHSPISGEGVANVNGHGARLPDDRLDYGIEAEFARGIRDSGEQVKRHRLIAVHQAKGAIAIDFFRCFGILRQRSNADNLLAGGIEAFNITGGPKLGFFRMHRICEELGEGLVGAVAGGEPHIGHDTLDRVPCVLVLNLAILQAHGGVAAIIGGERSGFDDVPDFRRAAVDKLRTELDGERGKRIMHCENAATDALAGFETQCLAPSAVEFAEGSESGGARADYCYFAVERQC